MLPNVVPSGVLDNPPTPMWLPPVVSPGVVAPEYARFWPYPEPLTSIAPVHERYVAPVTVTFRPAAPPLATGECVTLPPSSTRRRVNVCGPSKGSFAAWTMIVWLSRCVSPVRTDVFVLTTVPLTSVTVFAAGVSLLRMLVATTFRTTAVPSLPDGRTTLPWYTPLLRVPGKAVGELSTKK